MLPGPGGRALEAPAPGEAHGEGRDTARRGHAGPPCGEEAGRGPNKKPGAAKESGECKPRRERVTLVCASTLQGRQASDCDLHQKF